MGRKWLVSVSLAAHLGVAGGYVVVGMWRVERVALDRQPLQLVSASALALDDPGGQLAPGAKPAVPAPPKAERREVDEIVQPVEPEPEPDLAPTAATGSTTGAATPGAVPGGDGPPGTASTTGAAPVCLDPAGCATATSCQGPACDPPPRFVPPVEIAKARLTGETRILPSDVTKTAISRDGKARLFGMVRFCLDTRGRVTTVAVQKSTGYPAYDARLVDAVRRWTYRPHTIGATAIPACSTVSFAFSLR